MSSPSENFWDYLTTEEGEAAQDAISELNDVRWIEPLLRSIQDNGGVTRNTMPLLFELRFAHALHRAGVMAEYEIGGEGDSTLDFGFTYEGQPWRVELMRLHETQAARDASRSGVDDEGVTWFGRVLSSVAEDARESEEGETVQAVQRICQKCEKNGQPYKFPVPGTAVQVLLVDFRTFLHGGDLADRIHVGLGGEFVAEPFRRYWSGQLISGVFSERTPVRGAVHIRERVHFLGFVNEQSYGEGAFAGAILFVANPRLFTDVGHAREALARWPLQPARLVNGG